MKVILKSEVDNLGLPGDVVDVADGYGRNYLIPRGMAIIATRGAMKEAEALTRSRKVVEAKTLGAAEAARDALQARTLRLTARVDERGNLYGSVSAGDIQRVLKERGHDVPRKRIELKGTIKEIGTYEVPVRVHPQVTANVVVEVADVEGKVTGQGAAADSSADETDVLAEKALEAAAELEAEETVEQVSDDVEPNEAEVADAVDEAKAASA